jgi:two-component system, chemotaxis family, chemotaxis protein CheY
MAVPLGARGIGRTAISDVAPPPPNSIAPSHPLARASRPRTALIVDDSRVVRKVARPMIERLGFQVTEAENGEEALSRCKADMPGLVLLDWDMPVMTGIQFVSALRALDAPHRPKVVFCTSRSDTHDIFKGIEAGADEYVTKPFTDASLKAKLDKIGAL